MLRRVRVQVLLVNETLFPPALASSDTGYLYFNAVVVAAEELLYMIIHKMKLHLA